MSGEKKAVKEDSVFDTMENLKNEISMRVYEIDTMVKLGEEVAIAETEGNKPDIEWSVVFTIIGHIQKMAWEKINELDKLLAEQRVIKQGRLHLNAK